jgi:glycosyltransferase involved in cell wall biosynthesis
VVELLIAAFLLATALNLGYWLGPFRALARYRDQPPPDPDRWPPVTVIICARNAATHLRRHLPDFLRQDYPAATLLVVDDHSTDETAAVLLEFQQDFSNLRVIRPPLPTRPGKKDALEAGIRAAGTEFLLFSDADCRPVSDQWIRCLVRHLSHGADLVLGYSPYARQPFGPNRFQRLETIYTAIQYFSFALRGAPYMGVGRNLAYRRSLFLRHGGLSAHADLPSGDDDLFINQVAPHSRVALALIPRSFVLSAPARTWSAYYYQKFRHHTTAVRYRRRHQLALGLLHASHAGHYALALAVAWTGGGPLVLLTVILRWLIVVPTAHRLLRRFDGADLIPYYPGFDLVLPVYFLLLAPAPWSGRFWKKWK